jgi:hypothetical protein
VQKAEARFNAGMITSQFGCLEDLLGCMSSPRDLLLRCLAGVKSLWSTFQCKIVTLCPSLPGLVSCCCPLIVTATVQADIEERECSIFDACCAPNPYVNRQSLRAKYKMEPASARDAVGCCMYVTDAMLVALLRIYLTTVVSACCAFI